MGSLRIREIFNDARFMLIAVESVNFQPSKSNSNCWLYGDVKTIAVIICGPDKTYALDMNAKSIDLDQLREELPDLDTVIGPLNKA